MPRRLPLAAAAALCAALCPAALAADSAPSWAEPYLSSPAIEKYKDKPAVVLLEEWRLTVRNGERTGVHRGVVRINNGEGLDAGEVAVWSAGFVRQTNLRVWTVDARGRVKREKAKSAVTVSFSEEMTFDDSQATVVNAAVAPGGFVVFEADYLSKADFPQDRFFPQHAWPTARAVVAVSIEPRGAYTARLKTTQGLAAQPSSETSDAAEWVFEDVPAPPKKAAPDALAQSYLFAAVDYAPAGAPPTFRDWASVARWGVELYRIPAVAPPSVAALAAEVRASGGDPVAEAERRARGIRYFGTELGWGGLKPRQPEETLRRAFGDCKDKALLMVALLREVGVEAYPALVNPPALHQVDPAMPGPGFGHAIVAVPWAGRPRTPEMTIIDVPGLGDVRLIDATLSATVQADTGNLVGGRALVVSEKTSGLAEITPRVDAVTERRAATRITLDSSGDASVREEIVLDGLLEPWGFDDFVQKDERLRKVVFRRLAEERGAVDELKVAPPKGEARRYAYDVAYRWKDALAGGGALRTLDLGPFFDLDMLPVAGEADSASRRLPSDLRIVDRVEVELKGRAPQALPAPYLREMPAARLELRAKAEGDVVVVERELLLRVAIRDATDGDLRTLREDLRRLNSARLVLATP